MTMSSITTSPIATRTARFYTGQVVVDTVNGEVYEVEAQTQKNVRATNAKGQVWRISPGRLRLATAEEAEAFRASKVQTDIFYPGNIVKFVGTIKAPAGLWVVTKDTPSGYNLVRFGGDNTGRYYRSVPAASLTRATAQELHAEPFLNV